MTNLTEYTLPQLKQLQARITKEVSRRETDKKAALLKKLRKLAREQGMEFEDLLGKGPSATVQAKGQKLPTASKPASAKRAPLPAKYRNPNNLAQSWSGRGRKPAWFEAWVNNGGSLDSLENAAQIKGPKQPVVAPASAEPASDAAAASASPSPEVFSTVQTSE